MGPIRDQFGTNFGDNLEPNRDQSGTKGGAYFGPLRGATMNVLAEEWHKNENPPAPSKAKPGTHSPPADSLPL